MTMFSDTYEQPGEDSMGVTDHRQREDIRTLALSLGELAVRHVGVLLHLVEEEYGSRIIDIKEMIPKFVM